MTEDTVKLETIKFGFKDYTAQFYKWAKHHKQLSVCVKREKANGETISTENELLSKYMEEHPERLLKQNVLLFDRGSGEAYSAIDFHFVLDNPEYIESPNYYSTGASNTEQKTFIRLKFLLEDSLFYLDYSYNSGGHYAMSFRSFIEYSHLIKRVIDEILEQELPIEETGIIKSTESGDYEIILVNKVLDANIVDIELHELEQSLVAVEVYQYDMEIVPLEGEKVNAE